MEPHEPPFRNAAEMRAAEATFVNETTVQLGTERVRLRFDFNAAEIVERETGEGFFKVVDSLQSAPSARTLLALAYACSVAYAAHRFEDPPFTKRTLGSLMTLRSVQPLAKALTEIIGGGVPQAEDNPEREEESETAGPQAPEAAG